MKKIHKIYISAVLFFCMCGVLTLSAQNRVLFRNTNEAVRYYENLVGMLTKQVRSMQDENAMTVSALRDLQKRLRAMETDQQSLRQELQSLRRQISADAESRRAQFNALADRIVKQGPAAPSDPGRSPRNSRKITSAFSGNSAAQGGNTEQEFIEHTVEAGTTLSALARAYKVTIRDIEKANNIRKGRIYAGQKLLIPAGRNK